MKSASRRTRNTSEYEVLRIWQSPQSELQSGGQPDTTTAHKGASGPICKEIKPVGLSSLRSGLLGHK
eukprot:351342-Chlamydomonas_euryale.AAC.12